MEPYYEVEVNLSFDAAHHLPNHPTCGIIHGHRYEIKLNIKSEELDERDMVVDFGLIKHLIKSKYDHRNLNELQCFRDKAPTAERLSEDIYNTVNLFFNKHNIKARCKRVDVNETENYKAKYIGG